MSKDLSPEDKSSKIIKELDKLKDSSLKLSFWEEFVSKHVIIPEEKGNNKEQNS